MMDLLSQDSRRNPFPMYEQARRRSPVLYDESSKFWMIFDYDGVKRVVTDDEAFSSDLGRTANQPTPSWMIFFDPPRHTRLRALIQRAFTPASIAKLEPRIRDLSGQLLTAALERGAIDFVAEFAIPLPMMVIAEMVGIPSADWARFRRWSDLILKLSQTLSGKEAGAAAGEGYHAVTAEMSECLERWIEERRSSPAGDLLTRLIEAEVDGERLTHTEILALVQLLLVAGNETTTNLLNNAILCFTEHPGQLAQLRLKPEKLPSAIEEVLRYRSPLQFVFRGTQRDVQINGSVIPAGKLVLAMIGSANRDERQFADPAVFDMARDPNPHIAFGHGIHFCLGAPLSRLEGRVALSEFLTRVGTFRLASDEPWTPRHALHVHGPERLPLLIEPRA